MVVQLAEASGDRSEQGTDKQGRAGKQHRGRGRGREKRENAVAAVAGAGGEAPPVVPAAAQPPQLAATTAGARRRGRGAANSDSTALVVGVASLSLDSSHPAGKALPKPRSVVAPSAKAGGEGGNSRPIREPVNRHQAADTTAPQPPPKVQQPAPRFVIATQGGVTFQDDLHVGNGAGGYADQDEGQQQQQVYGQGMHEQYSNGNQGRNQGNFGNGHDSWMGHSQAQHTHQQHDDGAGSWSQQGGMPDQMGRGASSPIMMHQQPPSAAEGYEYGAQFAAQMTPPPATQRSYAPLPLLPSSPFMPTPQPQPPAMGSHGHYGLPAVLFPNQGAYPYPADGGWGLAQQQMQFMQQPPPLPQHPYPGTMGYGAPGMYPF